MTIKREELLNRLQILRPAVKSGGLIPEMSHIWFRDGPTMAYDGEALGIRVNTDLELECGLPGIVLMGLLGTSGLPEVSLEPDDSGTIVTVKMGRSRTKLSALDMERDIWPFPLQAGKAQDSLKLTDDLLRALKRVLIVDPKIVTRLEHRGVMVYRGKKDVSLCATDGGTIALVTLQTETSGGDPVMLPRAFAEQVVKCCSPGDTLHIYDDYLEAVSSTGTSVYSQVIDVSEAEDLLSIMEGVVQDHPDPVKVLSGFIKALERAVILDGKEDALVDVEIKDGMLLVTGGYKHGELNEKIKLKGKHPPAKAQFSAALVLRGLPSKSMSLVNASLVLRGKDMDDVYAVAARLNE